MQIHEIQEADYITPDQLGGIPGWHEGIPVFRIYTCGLFTIEMLVEVLEGDAAQARYVELPAERLSGRGPGSALKAIKLLISQSERYATKDWLRTHLREGQEVCATNKRLENIISYLRCHLLCLPSGKKLSDLLTYRRGTEESGDGYQLAGYPLAWVDIEALAWNVKQACLKERFNDDPLPYWEQAYTLASRGRFLIDEANSDWATKRREAVDDQMRQCVHALARLYLARYGQAGEEDVLRMLLPYCRMHCQDEDTLRPLLELLNKRGRYQEVVEWYERLKGALIEAGADKTGAVRTPQSLTTEIADFAQLKLREATSSKIVEEKILLNLSPGFSQRDSLSDSHLSASSLAHVVQLSQTWQTELPKTIFAEQGLLVSSEHRALLPLALSQHVSSFDSATWLGARVNDLKAFGAFWHRPAITCQQQQTLIHAEIEAWDKMTHHEPASEDLISRRAALRTAFATLATLSSSLLMKMQFGPLTTIVVEEFLAECTTSLTTCWHLMQGQEFGLVNKALTSYLPVLGSWAKQPSSYQQTSAYLASQGCLLMGLLSLHSLPVPHNFQGRVFYCAQATEYAVLSADPSLQITALTHLANAHYDMGQLDEMLQTYQKAVSILDKFSKDGLAKQQLSIPSLLCSKLQVGLAHAYAQHGHVQESLRALKEARALFPSEHKEIPVFLATDYGEYSLIQFEGRTHLDLEKYAPGNNHARQATNALAQIESVAKEKPVPVRFGVEITNQRAKAAIREKDRDKFQYYLLEGIKGAKMLGSEKRKQETVTNWKLAREQWPHDKTILELADMLF